MGKFIVERRYWALPLLFWAVLVAFSLSWNWAEVDKHHQETVTNRARFIFKMIESVRLWNARHGGLYAPVTNDSPPNPYLEVEERDISSPSGRPLTLINPAYMTRQLSGVVDEIAGVQIHITSLKPINPGNEAAPWEAIALERFETDRKVKEWSEFHSERGGETSFRYMAPLVTQKACLKCHEKQGYTEGDIRGGISVTFPPGPLLTTLDREYNNLLYIHLGVLLLLSTLTLLFLSRMRYQVLSLKEAKEQQEQLVHERTLELRDKAREHQQSEIKLRRFIETSGEGIFVVDHHGRFTLCNPAALQILGFKEETDILGKSVHDMLCPCEEKEQDKRSCNSCAINYSYRKGQPRHVEVAHFRCADGSTIPVEFRAQPLRDGDRVGGAVITFADISLRLERERDLRKLSKALEYSPVAALITDQEGHIEYVNRRFIEESGYRADEVIGRTPSLLKSGRTPEETYADMWQHLNHGEPWHGELLNRKKSGELFWEDTAIAPITDDSGKVLNFVAFKDDITQRKQGEEQVWRQANFDSLTGLPNRNLFHEQLEQLFHEAQRYQRNFALMFLDLDGFKEVNDTLGHDTGDDLLRQAAERLQGSTRSSDTVSRLGGDEFTVILPQFSECAEVEYVAQKLLDTLSRPFMLKGHTVKLSASIGIAAFPYDAADWQTLLNNADVAMYAAKRSGRNRYTFFADVDHDEAG